MDHGYMNLYETVLSNIFISSAEYIFYASSVRGGFRVAPEQLRARYGEESYSTPHGWRRCRLHG